jgi:serine protease Do
MGTIRRCRLSFGLRFAMLCGLLLAAAGPAVAVDLTDKLAAPAAAGAQLANPPQGIADMKALERTIQKTVAKATPSVVSISGGSGVVVSRDGYVLTVAHVGERAGRKVVVVFADGRKAKAVTLGNDRGVDAGMAKITDEGVWPHAEMGGSGDLKLGQWCLTLGYPVTFEHGKAPLVRIGRVLRNGKTEIITDGTIMGGDSGAPLFDLEGKVIGIGTKCEPELLQHNIHVPIDRFRDTWQQLAKSEDFDSLAPKRAILGVTGAEDAEEARIGTVVPGSPADKAGLKPDDVIVKFGGRQLQTYEELPPLVQQRKPGDKVEIELRRGEKTMKIEVTLGQDDAGGSR